MYDVSKLPLDLPPYFRGTWRMVACAFPGGVGDDHYWPLMILLAEGMSIRQNAAFMG